MFQKDLEPISYLPCDVQDNFLAVGWLSKGDDYSTGECSRAVYERLKELAHNPWQPFVAGGMHVCEICQFEGEATDNANLFIPYGEKLYIAPGMIVHYINAHGYLPPDEFCEAVLACPEMRSQAYRKALFACGGKKLIFPA